MPKIFSSKRKRCDGTSFTKGFLGYSCIGGSLTNAGEGASKGHLRAYLWKMMPLPPASLSFLLRNRPRRIKGLAHCAGMPPRTVKGSHLTSEQDCSRHGCAYQRADPSCRRALRAGKT